MALYLGSNKIAGNINNINDTNDIKFIDNQICETNELLNGKRVYTYNYVFSKSFVKNVPYEFELPFANEIDIAWVDLGNSFFENSKATNNFNIYNFGSMIGVQFKFMITKKTTLSITTDDNWGDIWTYHISIKFTRKN